MKKTKGTNPCGHVESPAKAKSRIKRFEQHLECNHRLANSYANNNPGDLDTVVKQAKDAFSPEAGRRFIKHARSAFGVPERAPAREELIKQQAESAAKEGYGKVGKGASGGGGKGY